MSSVTTFASRQTPAHWSEWLSLGPLQDWMDTQGLGRGSIEDARALTGGTQNLLLRFRRDGRDYVLRRPSRHPRPGADETMRREARVLAALADTPVRCPRFIAACPEPEVLGAAFYLMEPVDGVNISEGLPAFHANSVDVRRQMGLEMVDALLTLGTVNHEAVGLADFGRVDAFCRARCHAGAASWKATPTALAGLGLPACRVLTTLANGCKTIRPATSPRACNTVTFTWPT